MKKTIIIMLIIAAIILTACQSNATNTKANEAPNTIQKEMNTENNNITTETTQAKTEENTEQTTKEGTITMEELKKHNNENDCYVGYKGIAYDITDWINKHPGGTGIKEYCGTTTEFEQAFQKQHGTSKEAMLEKVGIKIGIITE